MAKIIKKEDTKPTLSLNGVTTARNRISTKKLSKNKHSSLPPENVTIKKEEEDRQQNLFPNGVSNDGTIPIRQVKVEEDTDTTKSLLKQLHRKQQISQEQINQFVGYAANHKMNVEEASRKVKTSATSGHNYYDMYKNDPEKKITLVRKRPKNYKKVYTPEQTE